MKAKLSFLLLVFLSGMIPTRSAAAGAAVVRDPNQALALLYAAEAILADDSIDAEASSAYRLSSPARFQSGNDPTRGLINQMINAAKNQRNDHFHQCADSAAIYRDQGKDCEADYLESYCKSRYQELTDKISILRRVRGGDERNFFTRTYHSVKRAGTRLWERIGPLGRKVLREAGPQALKIISSGGPGTESLLRNLFKHTVKKYARERLKEVASKAIQRALNLQLEVAAAAGVDVCDPEEESSPVETEEVLPASSDADEEYFIVDGEFEEAYASMDWDEFVPSLDGPGSCMRHQAYDETTIIHLEFYPETGEISGHTAGNAYATELGWESWGVYSVDGISGTVFWDESLNKYKFEGSANVDMTFRTEAYCPTGDGGSTLVEQDGTYGGTGDLFGELYLFDDDWYWNIHIIVDDDPVHFHLSCLDCYLGPQDP